MEGFRNKVNKKTINGMKELYRNSDCKIKIGRNLSKRLQVSKLIQRRVVWDICPVYFTILNKEI